MDYETFFDQVHDRRGSNAAKWQAFDADVLPMWVADMDFPSPPGVITALQERVAHGIFGYPGDNPALTEAIRAWLKMRFDWAVEHEWIVLLPGVVNGFNMAAHLLSAPQDGIVIQTPVYPPFLSTARLAGMRSVEMQLTSDPNGYYTIDLERFKSAIAQNAGMFLLCNPHNPVGRVFTRDELLGMATCCLEHDTIIVSDEIHADLVFPTQRHLPIASLDPQIAKRTITLMAPSKTFNIAGLECAFAVIPDPELRQRYQRAGKGLVGWVNL
ncbi:MAG: aminotransferase class I/II-fold pyridoxal phosphate-dependent enzyme, partial [Anaerolineae bacterium]|nr:aminotransferase class I/II-fold pyridoxal phosphate-dependent enzyme [Anaerolineae bacterium]